MKKAIHFHVIVIANGKYCIITMAYSAMFSVERRTVYNLNLLHGSCWLYTVLYNGSSASHILLYVKFYSVIFYSEYNQIFSTFSCILNTRDAIQIKIMAVSMKIHLYSMWRR